MLQMRGVDFVSRDGRTPRHTYALVSCAARPCARLSYAVSIRHVSVAWPVDCEL